MKPKATNDVSEPLMGPPELVYSCPVCRYTLHRGRCSECGYPGAQIEESLKLAAMLMRAAWAIWITFAVFAVNVIFTEIFVDRASALGLDLIRAVNLCSFTATFFCLSISLAYVTIRLPVRSLLDSVGSSLAVTMFAVSGLLTLVEFLSIDLSIAGRYAWVPQFVIDVMWVVPCVSLTRRVSRLAGTSGDAAHGFAITLKVIAYLMAFAALPISACSSFPRGPMDYRIPSSAAFRMLLYVPIFSVLACLVARRLRRVWGARAQMPTPA